MFGKSNFSVFGLAAALSVGATHLAAAAPADADRFAVALDVSAAGLDLTKGGDQVLLRHRVAVAASKLCTQITGASMLTDPGFEDCVRHVSADGRQQINARIAQANSNAMVAASGH